MDFILFELVGIIDVGIVGFVYDFRMDEFVGCFIIVNCMYWINWIIVEVIVFLNLLNKNIVVFVYVLIVDEILVIIEGDNGFEDD